MVLVIKAPSKFCLEEEYMHFTVQSPHLLRPTSAVFPSHPPRTPSSYTSQLWEITTDSKINVLFVFLPFVLFPVGSSIVTFVTSLLVIMPLANTLGILTEDIALSQSTAIATLINVTFGSATEFIINLALMSAGEFDLIQYSLLGSVLSNMLLDLGMSIVIYGLRPSSPNMNFNPQAVRVYSSVLMLMSFAFFVPMTVVLVHNIDVIGMSRQIALVLCVMYITYLVFQLRTHADMFATSDDVEYYASRFSLSVCFVCMAVLACLLSVASNAFVSNIETTIEHLHLTRHFIGVILIPMVGNAPEHVSTTTQAYKGNLDISFGIAIGSSIQISCFVVPLLVLIAWAFGQPLSMNFQPFSTIIMFVSVIVLNQNLRTTTGTCHWLNGALLMFSYAMLCIAFLHV